MLCCRTLRIPCRLDQPTQERLKRDIFRAGPIELTELFGLTRAFGYSTVDECASFEKARCMMTTPPKDDNEALYYFECIRGAAMRAFSLQHLKRYGFLPHLKEDPEHPQLKRWFAQKSPHINAFGPNAPSHHDWSKLKPAACKLFDEIVDPAALQPGWSRRLTAEDS